MTIEQVAKVAHQSNKAYCETIGDFSQVDWDACQEWQKKSAIEGVEYKIQNVEATPEQQHDAWSASKVRDGWVYGDTKDADKKTHPCLVPYDHLPVEQQVKDYIFTGLVKSLIPFIN